jgi:hypothetical protein
MGEAMASMDFKLYGTPETAQQILRLMSLTDGIGSLMQSAPTPLRELGGRLLDRIGPAANGNGTSTATNGDAPAQPNGVEGGLNLLAAQPHIAAASAILRHYLTEEELHTFSLSDGIAHALTLATADERMALVRVEGMLTLAPALADRPVAEIIG